MKSVALLSAVNPYPTDAGKKIVLAGFLEYFAARMGERNVHYVMVGEHGHDEFPAELHTISKPTTLKALTSVLVRTGTGRTSLQEALLYTPGLRAEVGRLIEQLGADLEVYDTIRMAQHAPARCTTQVCYLDDLFSERYRVMLAAAEKYSDMQIQPLGNFATHVPARVRSLAEHPRNQRALLRVEKALAYSSEIRVVNGFDAALLLNDREAQLLRDRCAVEADRVRVIPPLIGPRAPTRRDYTGTPEFIFLGLLSLPHNDDGLKSFLTHVWPLVLATQPNARLRVVGRQARSGLTALVARYTESVKLEGFVPDLSELFSRAAAMIVPLRFGSGIKLKIIEAIGGGVPVISTSIGAEGVATGADRGVLVADDHAELADLLLEATGVSRNRDLSMAALEHFKRCYSRPVVFARYDSAFGLA